MPQELVFSTSLKVRGPWLLEARQLLALDEILGRFRSIDPMEDNSDSGSKKSLTIFLSKERKLKTSSFDEAISHIASQDEVTNGFEYIANMVGITASVRLTPKNSSNDDDEEQQRLEIKVSPQSFRVSYDVFVELKNWADTVEAPLWQQWLLFELRPWYRIALGITLLLLFVTLFNTAPSTTQYRETLKQEARNLLHDGINQQNQTKAVELLLALESDYIPPETKPQQARRPIASYLVAVYVFGFLSFTPSLCIGIWAGKRHLDWWKLWIKLNTITVPGIVVAHWAYPLLFSTLESALRH